MTLDAMLGIEDGQFDENAFLKRIEGVLIKRSTEDDYEMHFLAFNAVSCIADYSPSSQTLDAIDNLLESYICTCKKASEADIMLCDLIVDHWYPERATRHVRALLLKTRYAHRRGQFYEQLKWHNSISEFPVDAAVRKAATRAAMEGIQKENRSVRIVSKQIIELFQGVD